MSNAEPLDNHIDSGHRSGIALCLSGGGFRAALFHLGALRRLNEVGALSKLNSISSVSGGSSVAAHIAKCVSPWPESGEVFPDWEDTVARPFKHFCSRNIRLAPLLYGLAPWNTLRGLSAVDKLGKFYDSELCGDALSAMPSHPRFVFCATDMVFGCNWISERSRVGSYLAGYASPNATWTVGRAVAASSCFPPLFPPLKVDGSLLKGGRPLDGTDQKDLRRCMRLTDGGVYDNLGLEPVWKSHATVLVSDGGSPFDFGQSIGKVKQFARYISLLHEQTAKLRRRMLLGGYSQDKYKGGYFAASSSTDSYPEVVLRGYSKPLARETISAIRTDLDAFSSAEAAILENHGYALTDATLHSHCPALLPDGAPVPQMPNPEYEDEALVRTALKDSGKVKLFGRF